MGKVLWFTGLSGSGKSTIAEKLEEQLIKEGKAVLIIDGDIIRNTLHKHLGFSPEDIKENNRLIANICKGKISEYDYILIPIISPFKKSREDARYLIKEDFIEVYVQCSLDTCISRDVKGYYKKALSGEINNFIGIAKENPYEPAENPEILVDTEKENLEESITKIKKYLFG